MTWLSIHDPDAGTEVRATLVLAHGAGGDRDAPMLRLLGDELAERGVRTVRIDLPFRRRRPKGPPSPSGQADDRAAFADAVRTLELGGTILWGGHSYGGRMASMAVAELCGTGDPGPAESPGPGAAAPAAAPPAGLLLLSYPLHPPGRPEKARTEHLPAITVPTVLVHGKRDPFATTAELADAAQLIAGPVTIVEVTAAHDLAPSKSGAPGKAADAVIALLEPGHR